MSQFEAPLFVQPYTYNAGAPLDSGGLVSDYSSELDDPQRDASFGRARRAKAKDTKPSKHMSCSACRKKKTRCRLRGEPCVWEGAVPAQPTKVPDDFPEASTAAQREIARLRNLVYTLATRLGLDPLNPVISRPSSPLPEQGPSPPSSIDSPVVSYAALSFGGPGSGPFASLPPTIEYFQPSPQYSAPVFQQRPLYDPEPDVKPSFVFHAGGHFSLAVEEVCSTEVEAEDNFEESRRMWPGASMPPFRGEALWS